MATPTGVVGETGNFWPAYSSMTVTPHSRKFVRSPQCSMLKTVCLQSDTAVLPTMLDHC